MKTCVIDYVRFVCNSITNKLTFVCNLYAIFKQFLCIQMWAIRLSYMWSSHFLIEFLRKKCLIACVTSFFFCFFLFVCYVNRKLLIQRNVICKKNETEKKILLENFGLSNIFILLKTCMFIIYLKKLYKKTIMIGGIVTSSQLQKKIEPSIKLGRKWSFSALFSQFVDNALLHIWNKLVMTDDDSFSSNFLFEKAK